ncbi:2-polyprenyl-6-methoxyphenol hydroxylase-like FAD-dependent oxidoreductase [Mycolicibacterium iranicum]|uniref:2-polyprenyl-6-methoxyphenol hydroxylase-like FAD-dependent oxidoreductase n=1 Tax=Mycolicibacterium iranicum TaxID=912594 RepID=A0A839Q5H2_MYCIR|nr:oxidoreductase [Mycolicibacterium iranicum]MBB2991320.1 2-polyprenyl-6-methoxyphenol hydroxylase-like FAD-dependent oxidoreductase [Mycolicibacterium iranicum]
MGQKHAIVIGASLGGLCAARVLSNFYDRVSVYERDTLPDDPGHRAAVPQSRHVHLLMARGAMEFESLFPGLLEDMVAAGVPMLENRPDCIHFGAAGHVLGTQHRLQDEFTAYVPSRKHLEWQIRRRVLDIDNVTLVNEGIGEPVFDGRRVTGVRTAGGATVEADLVVDATGRGTRLPVWLEQWGFGRPHEDTVDVGISYATHQLRIPDGLLAEKVVVAGASHDQPVGIGMLYYEDGTWGMTTFGVGKVPAPADFDEMCELADKILPAHVSAAVRQAEVLGDIALHKYPTSRWRRFDKMTRYPAGILPFGDAVVSFNPTFGQGMTMTSLQAGHLRRALLSPEPEATFLKATSKTTWPVWTMNAIGDLALHRAEGPSRWWYQPVGSLFDQFLGAAETDPVLAEWFLRRFSLLDSLYMVPSARLVGRTVRHNMTAWAKSLRRPGTAASAPVPSA